MKEVPGAANSETQITYRLKVGRDSIYELIPLTGRKHQLRLHLAAVGIPIVNDKLYPEMTRVADDDFSSPLKLLAKSLSFACPLTGKKHYFESGIKL